MQDEKFLTRALGMPPEQNGFRPPERPAPKQNRVFPQKHGHELKQVRNRSRHLAFPDRVQHPKPKFPRFRKEFCPRPGTYP
ncbi:hypothetical protein TNIN_428731 [Trichonephila inaurata madagascariensis]|uniref:Uncharacterized protein n=1 Tax=Trichonephila inaurata madagascariensis TaxID=2747483 RepID=A0A8X7CUD8_9ARAC|nr:hypothetical protein TNIN_428731 [Trichonephila inaurata madagascariensis]